MTHTESSQLQRPVISLTQNQGEAIWFLDTLVTTKLRAQDGADYGLIEYRMPEGARTPFHRHLREDESVYVLEGSVSVVMEDRMLQAGPGTFIHLPRGRAHGIIAHSASRMLVMSRPDGFVELTRALGVPAQAAELSPPTAAMPDLAAVVEVARRHGIEVLGPIPE